MRKNENTIVRGTKVALVPYNKEHVAKYHEWMKLTELQELTASEPLSLGEEYRMQESWREDEDKCTFIVLDADTYERTQDELVAMVGDTNLFFMDPEDDSEAEIEVMIAEEDCRGKGLGKEALLLMMAYGFRELKKQTFVAKIKTKNVVSRRMFEKLGFAEVSISEIFEEVTYRLVLQDCRKLLARHNATFELICTK